MSDRDIRPRLVHDADHPWVIDGRPDCIKFDDDSARESNYHWLLLIGLGLCFMGTYGCEPKRYRHGNPLHSEIKAWLFFGTLAGFFAAASLRARHIILQIIVGGIVVGVFGMAARLLWLYGHNAIPNHYFFPSFVVAGVVLAAIGAVQLLFTNDYLVVDGERGAVMQHTEYLFHSTEHPVCRLDRVEAVSVSERLVTHKGTTTIYLRVGLCLPNRPETFTVREFSAGTTASPKFSGTEHVVQMALDIAELCRCQIRYGEYLPHAMRRQPANARPARSVEPNERATNRNGSSDDD